MLGETNSAPGGYRLGIDLQLDAGARDGFAAWQSRATDFLSVQPGFVSSQFLRHSSSPLRWSVVVRFRTAGDRTRWLESEEWHGLREQLGTLVDSECELVCVESEDDPAGGAATEVIVTKVKPQHRDGYREWGVRIRQAQSQFPGFLGSVINPPAPGEDTWTTLISFDSRASLDAWMASAVRLELLEELSGMVEYNMAHSIHGSFPGWVPDDPLTGQAPPNWKTALLVLLGLYTIVSLNLLLLSRHIAGMPREVATLINCAIGVVLTTLVTMPFLIRRFGWWLYPAAPAAAVDRKGLAVVVLVLVLQVGLFHLVFRWFG